MNTTQSVINQMKTGADPLIISIQDRVTIFPRSSIRFIDIDLKELQEKITIHLNGNDKDLAMYNVIKHISE